MGTDGFEFVEYAAPDPALLRGLFERLGFPVVARHRSKNVTLHSQGDINFVINAEPESFGAAICAGAWARASAPWRFASRTPPPRSSARCRSAPNRIAAASGPWSSTFPPSSASAVR